MGGRATCLSYVSQGVRQRPATAAARPAQKPTAREFVAAAHDASPRVDLSVLGSFSSLMFCAVARRALVRKIAALYRAASRLDVYN